MQGFCRGGEMWRAENCSAYGGEGGIRTLVRVSPKHAFQACAFSRSATSPMIAHRRVCAYPRAVISLAQAKEVVADFEVVLCPQAPWSLCVLADHQNPRKPITGRTAGNSGVLRCVAVLARHQRRKFITCYKGFAKKGTSGRFVGD